MKENKEGDKNRMKRNTYLILITVITVICIICGTMYYAGEWGFGFLSHNIGEVNEKNGESVELEKFSSLVIESEVMDVHINRGEGYSLEYRTTKGLEPTYQVKNGTLTITQKKKHYNLFGINNGCDLFLTIPEDVTLSYANIESDVGDISINDMSWEKCDISADVGNIYVYGTNLGNAWFDSDTGDITLDECEFQSLDAQSDVGDVEISTRKELSAYELDFTTDVGDIRVNGRNYGRTFYQQGTGKNYVKIQGDVGDISFVYE